MRLFQRVLTNIIPPFYCRFCPRSGPQRSLNLLSFKLRVDTDIRYFAKPVSLCSIAQLQSQSESFFSSSSRSTFKMVAKRRAAKSPQKNNKKVKAEKETSKPEKEEAEKVEKTTPEKNKKITKGAAQSPQKKNKNEEKEPSKSEKDEAEKDEDITPAVGKKKKDEPKEKPKETQKDSAEKKTTKGRKRKSSVNETEDTDSAKKPKLKSDVSVSNNLSEIDFTSAKKSDGKTPNFKIASWNVNGVRAWLEKDGPAYLKSEQPDVLCLQELKCNTDKIPPELSVDGYSTHWLSGDKEGYSGVGIYYKQKPIKITDGIGIPEHDNEGRVITAEFDKFYLVNTYIPNSGRGLVRLDYRTKKWDVEFRNYLKKLDAVKPVVWCGDLNVSHQEIDIKNAKGNKKSPGFTQQERDGFSATLEEGFFDSFRYLNPELEGAYTYWTYMMNARGKNVGWRLDYFVMSEKLKENLCDSLIRSQVLGSDHCPIVLELAL